MLDKGQTNPISHWTAQRGQAMVEYALIVVLVVMALAAAVAATGPAIGNVFSNVVCNLIEQQQTCGTPVADLYNRGGPTAFWLTVTAVATNPPTPRGFPTDPATPPKATNTPGPSPTPSPTVPTPTPSYTPTQPPTPTPTDIGHDVPFVDPIDQPVWWRVDSSVYLGGNGWKGEYYPGTNLDNGGSVPPDATMFNQQLDPADTYTYDIAFDWGAGGPSGGSLSLPGTPWKVDSFSVRWTRDIYVASAITVNVTLRGDDGYRFYLDGALKTAAGLWSGQSFSSSPTVISLPLTVGNHKLMVEYKEVSGNAGMFVEIAQYKGNVNADTALPSGAANCQWTRITGPQPNSIAWTWKESANPTSSGFPPSMRCNLELRGWVNLSSAPNQSLTLWDAWDLTAGTSIKLQLAEYVPYNADGTGGPNWTQFPTTTLHTGTANYNWTRSRVAIPSGLVGKKLTYRFVMESDSGAGNRRWYLDDLLVDTTDTGKVFDVCTAPKTNCPTYWDMNSPDEKADFITTGRWDLTSDNIATNDDGSQTGTSWAISGSTNAKNANGTSYVNFGPEQPSGTGNSNIRIHAIEFNGNFNFVGKINDAGSGGTADFQGDDSFPQVTFSFGYDLGNNDAFELQYTFDALDNVVDNWQPVPAAGITGYPINAGSSGATNTAMTQVSVPLNPIPNWNKFPFRLRFALKVDNSSQKAGVWIDNIVIDRVGVPRFSHYPFCEDAEGSVDQWTLQGSWGTAVGGAFGSARSFTDSPSGNYIHGQQTSMTLRYPVDFNNDTPENFQAPNSGNKDCINATSGAAIRPILSFFWWRRLAPNESLSVDLYRAASTKSGTTAIGPTAVWTYNYNSTTRDNLSWEHAEVDLDAAIKQLTGSTLSQLAAVADPRDDDFYIAFRLDARSDSSVADGVYLDVINMSNYTETSHKLWNTSVNVTPVTGAPAAGVGNGARYIDDIDNPSTWFTRWTNGGSWTRIDWDPHSSTYSFTDSPPSGTTYRHGTFSVLEMTKIIDLRGAKTDDNPILYYWDHYDLGNGDIARVEIAVQDQYEMTGTPIPPSTTTPTKRSRQGYNYLYDWGSDTSYGNNSSWQTQAAWSIGPSIRRDTWGREQIDLSAFADNPATTANEGKRIKIRFVLDAYNQASGLRDGWFIDDIRIELKSPLIHSLPFIDHAQNMSNWIAEGKWGLAPDYFRGSGGDAAVLGPNKWNAYYFDCIQWMATWWTTGHTTPTASDLNQVVCDQSNTTNFLDRVTRTVAGTNSWISTHTQYPILTEAVDTIDNNFGTTGRPFGAPLGASGVTWDDYYMGRWMRDITVNDGDFTFITTSDDGVRLRYETNPAGGAPSGWNIINNWTGHSTQVNIKTVHFAAGSYQLVLEWFEATGGAVIRAQVGNDFFSFSDSPKASAASTKVNSVAYGNSSLMLDGVIPLDNPGGVFIPRLQYFVYYDLGASAAARAEVSIDGGFSWTQGNLNLNCPAGVPSSYCDPTTWGTSRILPENGYDWQPRSHDLRSFVDRDIILRFRLTTTSDVRDGWWITDIEVR